jgi:predicted ester cyclase
MNRISFLLFAATLITGCAPSDDSLEIRNRKVVRAVFSTIWSEGNIKRIPDLFAENFVGHFPDGTVQGPEGLASEVGAHRKAFPDWTEEVEDWILDRDRVAVRVTSSGTNTGAFSGNPPTGNRVQISEVAIFRLADGKIVEQWVYPDILSLQRQLSIDDHEIDTKGTLSPSGSPLEPPTRTDAGESCVVDLTQTYSVTGSLSGSLEADYRILVAGVCGAPIGTFDEQWIAHGTFNGTLDDVPASGRFTYTARVKAAGEVEGRIVFGQGLQGTLRIHGNFGQGYLSYEGDLE